MIQINFLQNRNRLTDIGNKQGSGRGNVGVGRKLGVCD